MHKLGDDPHAYSKCNIHLGSYLRSDTSLLLDNEHHTPDLQDYTLSYVSGVG